MLYYLFSDHVWQVSVKPKGLGASKTICGDYRLCLSESEICMIKKNSDRPEFTFQVRCFCQRLLLI